ncbi:MAG TPA: hypothetical protein DD719_02110 [Desulfotomaculum sp.]|jgi:hypothetical protein|nr:hypothetical protein [Desulfotomaculum sp.]HCJ79257.1 hypothetical protein [Desulfotomaculum sp.]
MFFNYIFRYHKLLKVIIPILILIISSIIVAKYSFKSYLYILYREIMRTQTLLSIRCQPVLAGEHFLVAFTAGDYKNAQMVLQAAEHFYQPICKDFNVSLRHKIPVILYPTPKELNASFGWTASESTMGAYWAGIIRVLSPQGWIYTNNYQEKEEIFISNGPMAHEITHLMVDYMVKGNIPRWLTEGIAQFEEKKLTGFRFDYPDFISQPLYPLAKMDRGFDQLPDQMLAYRQSLSLVEYLHQAYGPESLKKILAALSQGKNINLALREAGVVCPLSPQKKPLAQLDSNWQAWLTQTKQR